MSEIGRNRATDFLVTFFISDVAVTKKLSDVIKNKENKLFRSALGLPKQFVLPLFTEEVIETAAPLRRYFLKADATSVFHPYINDEQCDYHSIDDGDYIAFKNEKGAIVLRLLFIATLGVKPGYKKFALQKGKNIFIGRDAVNDISFGFSDRISREKHAALRVDGDGSVYIEDLKRSVGVYVNGRLTHSKKLGMYDEVFIMGLSIINFGTFIAIRDLSLSCRLKSASDFDVKPPAARTEIKHFVRTPRIQKSLDTDVIEIEAPPNLPAMDKTPAILALGPSATMSIAMLASLSISITNALNHGNISTVIASGIMAVGMLLGAIMWPNLLRRYQQRTRREEEKHRHDRYSAYISEMEEKLLVKSVRAVRLLNENLNPPPEQLCKFLDDEKSRLHLWERSFNDNDFLNIRLGLGKRPFDVKIAIPKQGFQLHVDELRAIPVKVAEKYSVLSGVPVTLDLMNNKVAGIIGDKANIRNVVDEVILNVVSLHSYDEVKLVIICSEKEAQHYDYVKNIPHIWSNDKKLRYFATNNDEVHFVFNAIDDIVKERENNREKKTAADSIPYFLFIITEESLIENEVLLRYIENPYNTVGIISLFAYGDIYKLPKNCETIIRAVEDDDLSGYYSRNKNENRFIKFSPDKLLSDGTSAFMKKLANLPVKVDVRSLSVPDRISFLQMYKAGNVAELEIEKHWNNNNSAKSLAAPIGLMAGGVPFSLDVHEAYHGCHGLVAGTTGSGKSEFLQAFVLSLAINYSPKEVAFVLVDFKGGDMARPFMAKPKTPALPHLAATISNLSGNILYRALVSFEAEIKWRQRLFNESAATLGVDKLDINSYHKYYKAGKLTVPLPHLIIIIDEFAQLKTQQPDFLAQLINVAQVGRSLGIHLILATQKPSGVVDPQIWSNSRFKVCLKVADKQDSIDMISKPDSAMIKNPGRCYVQVGYDEIYECVQSAYSGADYVPTRTYLPDDEITVQLTDNTATPIHGAKLDLSADKTDKTQLEASVADIVALGVAKKLFVKPLWKDMLPEKILLGNLGRESKSLLRTTIGLADFVRIQEQKPLFIDFDKSGHIAVYGASGTGKTTFLQTLIYSLVHDYAYTPDELNIYAMDFGGRSLGYLNALPHVGGVIFEDGERQLADFADLLKSIIDERKRIFAANNCGTFTDYCATGKQRVPAILVLIDNYASFHDKYMDISERFFGIFSSGKTYGVYFVVTGNTRNAIYYKVTEHISTYFTLKMNDSGNYFDILNVRPPIMPEDIKGRGITVLNKEVVEFQVALAVDGEIESDRVSEIYNRYAEIARQWKDAGGALPVKLADVSDNETTDYSEAPAVSYTSAAKSNPPDIIFDEDNTLVLGASVSGASLYGLNLASDFKLAVCADTADDLLDYYKYAIKNILSKSNRRVVFIDDGEAYYGAINAEYPLCRYIKGSDELSVFFEEIKPELNIRLDGGGDDKLFIIISNFNDFFEMITDEQADFMRKITRHINDAKYGVCFICGFNVNESKSNDRLFMDLVVKAENYVICPNSYKKVIDKVENFPLIHGVRLSDNYFCQKDRSTKIRR